MFKNLFKKLLVIVLLTATTGLFAQTLTVGNSSTAQNESVLMYQNDNATTIRFALNEIDLVAVETDYGRAVVVMSDKAPFIMEKGSPELFFLTASFIIPDMGSSVLDVSYGAFTEYENIDVAPSKGNILRSVDPTDLPFVKGEVYGQNKFYPETLAGLREPFIIRDVRGQSVDVFPVQYNPVTKVLRVYSEITVTVNYTNDKGVNEFANQKRNATIAPDFNQMYSSMFLNYGEVFQSKTYPVGEEGELLIICHPDFLDAMKPYVDWKRTIGRKTTMVSTAVTGTTPTSIKSYVSTFYNNPANNLTYILLVGGHNQVPTYTYNSQAGGSPNPAGSDHYYGQLVGTDPYIEVFVGRFSAETPAHVETQVQRTIHHERDIATTDTWLNTAIGLAANEGGSGTKGHDSPPEADYAHMEKIKNRLLNFGYSTVYQEYTMNCPGIPNTNYAQISSRFNAGAGMANYCNHGSKNGWEFMSPPYSSTHVSQLQNAGKLPMIHSVACVNGRMKGLTGVSDPNETCFAETWTRSTQGGQPTGAVAVLMATLNLWWNPPMTAQDAYVNICLDLPPYYPAQPAPETKRTFAGATLNAGMIMMLIHGSAPSNEAKEDFESWLVFGDPTLMFRTKAPQEMNISHNNIIFFGMSEFPVTCDADGALVTMSTINAENEVIILGTAVVNGGVANLVLNEPISSPAPLTLAIVGHNKVTYLNTGIIATPASGPYVVPNGYTVLGEDKLTYISTNQEIEVTLSNVGIAATNGLTATLTCDDPQITIVNGTATCSGIAPDGTATVKFKVTVSNDIPDNKTFLTNINIAEDGKAGLWENKLALKAFAPVFSLEKVLVDGVDGGSLSAGTVVTFTTMVKNKGGADAYKVKGNLDINSAFITFACEDQNPPEQLLPAGATIEIPFVVVTSPAMPYGHQADIDLLLNAQYGRSDILPFTVSNVGASNYCSSGSQNCGEGDRITSVILYKTSAPSNLLINQPSITACSSDGYQDYTNINIPLEPGQGYTIKIKCGYNTQQVGGWFDMNGNGVFDSNEKLITMSCSSSGTEYTGTFTVPTDFAPGTSRFRLVDKYSGTPAACSNTSYGSTYDYTITLPELYPRVENVVAVLQNNDIKVTWNAPASGTPTGYNIYRNGNKLNATLLTALTFTEVNITEGVYAYNVTAMYTGNKESFAQMSNVICHSTSVPCVAIVPTYLAVETAGNNAILTWEYDEEMGTGTFLGYNVYRNGTKLNANPIAAKTYTDADLDFGEYTYQVTTVYEGCESDPTDGVTTIIMPPLPCADHPDDLAAEVEGSSVILTWEDEEEVGEGELLGYNVYRDEIKLNEDPVEEKTYTDKNLENGTYNYQVTTVYEHCESEPTDEIPITILILPCEAPVDLAVEVEDNNAILTWKDDDEMVGEPLGYNVYRDGIQLNEDPIEEKTYTDEDLDFGEYTYQVTAVYEDCESDPTDGVTIFIMPPLPCADSPDDLAVEVAGYSVILTWEYGEEVGEGELLGYNVYRDGIKLNEDPIEEKTYTDADLEVGTYSYHVTAVYENCESDLPEGVIAVIDVTGICDLQKDTYSIFPNPTQSEVNITGTIVPNNIRIYNITGQLVYETSNIASLGVASTLRPFTLRLDVAQLPTGVYFIKIESNTGSTTRKLIRN